MMTEKLIYSQLSQLSDSLKQEVFDYIEFLVQKQVNQTQQKNYPKKRIFGSAKGKYQLAADFDKSLDDFKDYMS